MDIDAWLKLPRGHGLIIRILGLYRGSFGGGYIGIGGCIWYRVDFGRMPGCFTGWPIEERVESSPELVEGDREVDSV